MLTAADFPVTPQATQLIFEVLKENYFSRPQAIKGEVVYVAGQPASGKSTVIESVRNGHAVLDSDEIRKMHPALDEIMRLDPLRMDVLTNGPVPFWMSSLIEYAREHGHSLIIENTLSNPEFIAGEIEKFRVAGFNVRIVALAVAQEVSRLGIVQRYLAAKRTSKIPRWTNEVAHTNGYRAIVPGLRALEGMVYSLEIRTRDGRILDCVGDIDRERREWFGVDAVREKWLADFDALELAGLEGEKLTQNLIADARRLRDYAGVHD